MDGELPGVLMKTPPLQILVRHEGTDDALPIRAVVDAAFPGGLEAKLVDSLRGSNEHALSLVAVSGREVVGHVSFSPTTVDGVPFGVGLAPVAVLPQYQRRGIGGALIRAGLKELEARGVPVVFVLGEPEYYSRFGFAPAARYGFECVYGGGDAFQLLALRSDSARPGGGLVQYSSSFGLFGE